MKKLIILLSLLIFLVGCEKKIEYSKLSRHNEIYYEEGSTKEYTGKALHHDEDGDLMFELNIKEGRLQGTQKLYYKNGQIQRETNYKEVSYKNGLKNFGDKLGRAINMTEDKLHGYQREYYKNGQLKKETYYEEGKLHGVGKEYDENGVEIKK